MKVELTIIKGPDKGKVMEFREPRGFVIGRARDADLQLSLEDEYVSRRHVFLEICPPACRLRNLGTSETGATNPPHVNRQQILEDCELKNGDIIELGYTELKVSISDQVIPQKRNCRSCNRSIEFLAGEPEPEECPECAEKKRREPKPTRVKMTVRCSSCGLDLTERANSDGRAEELQGVVVYSCEKCLSSGNGSAGVSISNYRVLKQLGEGGMGSVYLVYHQPTARVLALKQMKDLKEALLVKRFDREMRLLQNLNHPNVVRCIEAGVDPKGAPFIVTEFVQGGDLENVVLATGGRLGVDLAVHTTLQVLRGMEYLHQKQIIHRDIKPQNILLHTYPPSTGGRFQKAMITDFGLAYSYGRAGGTRVTKYGDGLGTLMYMSPEQVQNAADVREPADLYSLGVMLYYLLTGQYSFDFPTPKEILEFQKNQQEVWKNPREALKRLMQLRRINHPFQIILGEEPIPIRKREPSIPKNLAEVVDKAVRKDSKKRFQSTAEFSKALEGARKLDQIREVR